MAGSDSGRYDEAALRKGEGRVQRPLCSCQASLMGQATCHRAGHPQTLRTRKYEAPFVCLTSNKAPCMTQPGPLHLLPKTARQGDRASCGLGSCPVRPLLTWAAPPPWASVSGGQEDPAGGLAVGPALPRETRAPPPEPGLWGAFLTAPHTWLGGLRAAGAAAE